MIDLARFSAVGLPGFDAHVRAFGAKCAIIGGSPALSSMQDVRYTPARKVGDGARYEGGLFTADGKAIPEGGLYRGGRAFSRQVDEEPTERLEEAIYLGWLFPAYGHALLESLSRCWALDRLPNAPLVFHAPTVNRTPEFFAAFLDRLGIGPDRVHLLNQPTRIDRLHVPDAAIELKRRAYGAARETFGRIAGESVTPSDQPLYVSRARLPDSKRLVIGEDVLEGILSAEGFAIIHPETMTIDEQVRAFSHHTTIVGPIGSAMHNIVFNRSAAKVAYLVGTLPSFNYMLCDSLIGAQSSYIRSSDFNDRDGLGRSTPLRMRLQDACAGLASIGLLNASGLDLAEVQRKIDARHTEAWRLSRKRRDLPGADSLPDEDYV